MPEDLLLELETSAPVAGNLQNIEDLVRIMSREVSLAVEGTKGSARRFEEAWKRIVIDVAQGRTAAIQAVRSRLLSALEKQLGLLQETYVAASWLLKHGTAQAPDPDVLLAEIVGLERLKSTVFDRWQTAEDLEDLAARDYPLTTADLAEIGPRRRPPASFYAEDSKPF
jgi:hypothetical protein